MEPVRIERVRPLRDLLATEADDAWNQVQSWCAASRRLVEIFDCPRIDGEATLLATQVTTRSPMGAVALHCGGIQIDRGWLRFLGAGSVRMGGGLREWNESLGGRRLEPPIGDALVVAYDALGGWFALNGGRWAERPGGVHYLTPDAGGWQSLDVGYSGLLEWSPSDAVDPFYEGQRWTGWQTDVANLGPDQAISIYPALGFEASPLADRSRMPVPVAELWAFHQEIAQQINDLPEGAEIEFRVEK